MAEKPIHDAMSAIPDITDRERLLLNATASLAADLAVERMTSEFYKNVGKFTINKFLILLGAVVVGIAVGKGWVKF